jgi:immunity protein 27 of polymorphic toxin system
MLKPDETALIGHWLVQGVTVVADETCRRIETLLSGQLVEMGHTRDGWSTLFRDPIDGRLWERTYPQSHMQGGGPPALHWVAPELALAKYDLGA